MAPDPDCRRMDMKTDYRLPDPEELVLIEREAQRLRARFVADNARVAVRALAHQPARVAARLRRAAHI